MFPPGDDKAVARDSSPRDLLCSIARSPVLHAVPASKLALSPIRLLLNLLPIESMKTAKTENTLEPNESHEMLRADLQTNASRFLRSTENSIPGVPTLSRSQTRPRKRAEIPEVPKIMNGLHAKREAPSGQPARCHASCCLLSREAPAGPKTPRPALMAAIALISKSSMEWASEQHRRLPAPICANCRNRPSLRPATEACPPNPGVRRRAIPHERCSAARREAKSFHASDSTERSTMAVGTSAP